MGSKLQYKTYLESITEKLPSIFEEKGLNSKYLDIIARQSDLEDICYIDEVYRSAGLSITFFEDKSFLSEPVKDKRLELLNKYGMSEEELSLVGIEVESLEDVPELDIDELNEQLTEALPAELLALYTSMGGERSKKEASVETYKSSPPEIDVVSSNITTMNEDSDGGKSTVLSDYDDLEDDDLWGDLPSDTSLSDIPDFYHSSESDYETVSEDEDEDSDEVSDEGEDENEDADACSNLDKEVIEPVVEVKTGLKKEEIVECRPKVGLEKERSEDIRVQKVTMPIIAKEVYKPKETEGLSSVCKDIPQEDYEVAKSKVVDRRETPRVAPLPKDYFEKQDLVNSVEDFEEDSEEDLSEYEIEVSDRDYADPGVQRDIKSSTKHFLEKDDIRQRYTSDTKLSDKLSNTDDALAKFLLKLGDNLIRGPKVVGNKIKKRK